MLDNELNKFNESIENFNGKVEVSYSPYYIAIEVDGKEYFFQGEDAEQLEEEYNRGGAFTDYFDFEDYLKYVAEIQGQNPEEKVPALCDTCGLKEVMHKNISELSRGYRQRVGLAHALMNDPEILILDEPTSGLDPNQIEDVRALIKEIGKTRTVIISTHILGEVEILCSRVIIIAGGKLVADSPTDKLRERYGNNATVKITTDCPENELSSIISAISAVSNISFEKEENSHFSTAIISIKDESEIRPEIAKAIIEKGFNLYELSLQRNSLEDVFHSLTTDSNEENTAKGGE